MRKQETQVITIRFSKRNVIATAITLFLAKALADAIARQLLPVVEKEIDRQKKLREETTWSDAVREEPPKAGKKK